MYAVFTLILMAVGGGGFGWLTGYAYGYGKGIQDSFAGRIPPKTEKDYDPLWQDERCEKCRMIYPDGGCMAAYHGMPCNQKVKE